MKTRQRHIVSPSTIEALQSARNGHSVRSLACDLGFSESYAATVNDVLKGKPGALTLEGENMLRRALGLTIIDVALAPVCSRHGIVHCPQNGDCGKDEVATVECLSAGERIAPPGAQIVMRRPPQRWRDMPVSEVAKAIRERKEYRPWKS